MHVGAKLWIRFVDGCFDDPKMLRLGVKFDDLTIPDLTVLTPLGASIARRKTPFPAMLLSLGKNKRSTVRLDHCTEHVMSVVLARQP